MGALSEMPSLNTDRFLVRSGYATYDGKLGLNKFIFGNSDAYYHSTNIENYGHYIGDLTFEEYGGIPNRKIPVHYDSSKTYESCYNNAKRGVGRPYAYSVLPNCTGLAAGLFNKAYCLHSGEPDQWVFDLSGNAGEFISANSYKTFRSSSQVFKGLTILNENETPPLGGIAVWSDSSLGHVAFIQEVDYDSGDAVIWESGWKTGYWCKDNTISKSNGYAHPDHSSLIFEGFIANPAVIGSYVSTGAFVGNSFSTPYIFDGSIWRKATPYIFNGSEWKKCKR